MTLAPDALDDRYHVEFYGDDIAWLWIDPEDGKLYGMNPESGVRVAKDTIEAGVRGMPVGVDLADMPIYAELARQGIDARDGQQVMLDDRQIKNRDEITMLSMAAAMVDGTYQDIVEALKPGVRENEIAALANKRLYEMGSDDVESINAVSGERCNPHPHNLSDRMIRPGDPAVFDIMHSYNGYDLPLPHLQLGRATTAQRDAFVTARGWIDAAIEAIKLGVSTRSPSCGPPRSRSAWRTRRPPSACCSVMGLARHERPIISRVKLAGEPGWYPREHGLRPGGCCPATDGCRRSASRKRSSSPLPPSRC
jgi:hypothetical protein